MREATFSDRSHELSPAAAPLVLQRKCACGQHTMGGDCASCAGKRTSLQRKAAQTGEFEIPGIVHDVLQSPGVSLDPAIRGAMELRFGHDFSNVRIHTDSRASQSAQEVNARAYTVGSEIVFASGQHDPRSPEGRQLIAHELAHVVQQSRASGPIRQTAEPHLEAEANSAPTEVLGRTAVPVLARSVQAPVKKENYAETRERVVKELDRKMPVALIGMIAELDDATRERLADDSDVKARIAKLPPSVRLRVQKYLLFGRNVPPELQELERAAEAKDVAKVEQGLEALRKKREGSLNTIETGNIKEKIEYEFRGTAAEKDINKKAESALEFSWQEMLNFARQSKTLRDLEAAVNRRHPGLRASKGESRGGTQSNAPMNYLVIEPNVSLKGAVVRYAHELENLWMDQDYERIKERAKSGGYASAGDCAKEVTSTELQAVVVREKVASELGFTYSPEAAKVVTPPPENLSEAEKKKVREKAYVDLQKAYEKPVTEGGKGVLPGYERLCRMWMGQP
jgi:Domain of unknown function (DUF4157)